MTSLAGDAVVAIRSDSDAAIEGTNVTADTDSEELEIGMCDRVGLAFKTTNLAGAETFTVSFEAEIEDEWIPFPDDKNSENQATVSMDATFNKGIVWFDNPFPRQTKLRLLGVVGGSANFTMDKYRLVQKRLDRRI